MKKVLFIVPHLSTGGLPQYTFKLMESLKKDHNIFCLEYQDITGGVLTVQRNKILNLLDKGFYSLSHFQYNIHQIISLINPDVIHFQEIPETFIPIVDLQKIYSDNRLYKIVVTTHGSHTNPKNIIYGADKFILVSNWSKNIFVDEFGKEICDVWEYPITKVAYNKDDAKRELGFDFNYKHVLNVGLFTPGKNQKELIDIAKNMINEKVKFHFVGNQAENFREYWQPLIENFPDNCIWHGERDDVDKFYKAADVFYFTSNFELNPLVIKEALSYDLPVFMKKLNQYENQYDNIVEYISGNIDDDIDKLKSFLFKEIKSDAVTIILAHADTVYRKKLLKECIESIDGEKILTINCLVDTDIQEICDHVLYTKNNPLLFANDFSKYNVSYNYWWIDETGIRQTKPFDYEHGYASYSLIQTALRYAKHLGKSKIHVINYDYLINKTVFNEHNELLETYDMIFYEHDKKDYDADSYNCAFFSGKINKLQSFFEKYKNMSEYYLDSNEFNILEIKLCKHYTNTKDKVILKKTSDLAINNGVNREGVLDFSKSQKYEKLSFKELCIMFNCDKGIGNDYDKVYETILSKYKNKEINLFEIGLDAGNSLRVWENFLPLAKIYGMDINTKPKSNRGDTFVGDQNNINDLDNIVKQIPKCDIIIDDGSRVPNHQLKSFNYLFKNLLEWGGVYIIENIECSYWRPEINSYGFETGYLNIIDYFTKLNHSVNNHCSNHPNELFISSISYYPNCIVIHKKTKNELENKQYRFQNFL